MSLTTKPAPTSVEFGLLLDAALNTYLQYTNQDLRDHQLAASDQWESIDSELIITMFREQSQLFNVVSDDGPELIEFLEPIVHQLHGIGEGIALGVEGTLVSPTQFHFLLPTHVNAYFRHPPLKNMSYVQLASSSPCVSLLASPASSQ